ncbi:unnamed protein product [Rhizoctonia solani]|uniref:Uncharacterized protein n=1 Tax=Rhizoctonia solani TaxID=456999 RepID=A0A8H3C942_9AGAM|nr:unnamed protein product [Rhizoctonia solani]
MEEYKYSWKPSSELPIDEFLQKYKPTMVVDDGTKPWIWVQRLEHEPLDSVNSADSKDSGPDNPVIESAHKLLESYTGKIASIQKDESIPVRANKKKGLRSKKEVREEVAAEATEKFKQLSQESKLTCGKLLLLFVYISFPTCSRRSVGFSSYKPSKLMVYRTFSRMARDLVAGALSNTPAFCLKVATTPADVLPNHRYLICLYLPDLYDKAVVTEVLRTVCQSTGVRPNSAKTDLYTIIGLDSKHPSGIKSTIWNPTDLVPDAELKALTDAYWSEAAKKAAGDSESTSKPAEINKKKPTKRPRKRESEVDIFDDVKDTNLDDDATTTQDILNRTRNKSTTPFPKVPSSKVQEAEDSATESESDEAPPTKTTTGAATGKPTIARRPKPTKPTDDSSSDEEVKKPKRIRRF